MTGVVDELVVNNIGLVKSIVYKMHMPKELRDDAVSEGYLGLVEAAKNYNPTVGAKFSTYAYECISKRVSWFISCNGAGGVKIRTSVLKSCGKVRDYMRVYEVESPENLKDDDWTLIGVDKKDRAEVIACFCSSTSIDDKEDVLEDIRLSFEESVESSDSVRYISCYIKSKYKNPTVMLGIVQYISERGSINLSEIASQLKVKRQSVFAQLKRLQKDEKLHTMLSSLVTVA